MLIDMHLHTSGVSCCSDLSPEEAVARAKKIGTDGFVLTNHYSLAMRSIYSITYGEWLRRFLAELSLTKRLGKAAGIKVFCGVEYDMPGTGEFLLYGITEEHLLGNNLFGFDQRELYGFCQARGIAVFQAHPFRVFNRPASVKYMDGIEVNLNPRRPSETKEALAFAKKHNLLTVCGTDSHIDSDMFRAGVDFPYDLADESALAAALKTQHPLVGL